MLTNTSSGAVAHQLKPLSDQFPLYSCQTSCMPSMDQTLAGGKRRITHTMSRRSHACEVSKMITLEMLRPYFHKPLAEAAAHFGICVTLLKKICRRNGVSRWPHRQVQGLLRSIESIEESLASCGKNSALGASYQAHLTLQKAKLRSILHGFDSKSIQYKEESVSNVKTHLKSFRDMSSHVCMDEAYSLHTPSVSSRLSWNKSPMSVLQRPSVDESHIQRNRLPPITVLLHPKNDAPLRSASQNQTTPPTLGHY